MSVSSFNSPAYEALLQKIAEQLARKNWRIVFAESCTAGMIVASLGRVAGISEHLCGGMVTYREASKINWLEVSESDLSAYSAVSRMVTDAMATQLLRRTPEAHIAMAITGHLGPITEASDPIAIDLDGQCFLAIAVRRKDDTGIAETKVLNLTQAGRIERQFEASESALNWLAGYLESVI